MTCSSHQWKKLAEKAVAVHGEPGQWSTGLVANVGHIVGEFYYRTWTVMALAIREVQTFNSCTSRPGVCHFLIVQTPMNNMPKIKQNAPITHVPCELKLRSIVRSSMH